MAVLHVHHINNQPSHLSGSIRDFFGSTCGIFSHNVLHVCLAGDIFNLQNNEILLGDMYGFLGDIKINQVALKSFVLYCEFVICNKNNNLRQL